MCWANRHTFIWGSSTTVDAMPLSLRCECGAVTREDINPIMQLQAEIKRLREQLNIATELLEKLSQQRGKDMRYPGEHATLAEDALIRMSVAE